MKKYYPDLYISRITDVKVDYLKENNIQGLIIDVDNTITDLNRNLIDGLKEWHDRIREKGIKTIILSNTIMRNKVKKIAEYLGIKYIYFANKPMSRGFKSAAKKIGIEHKNIAVIGDQIFTDIKGANNNNMHSILVKPICEKKDYLVTMIKRPFEKKILNSYLNDLEKGRINKTTPKTGKTKKEKKD